MMTMTSDPTTPDAVERQYQDSDGNPCDLVTLCRREPEWAANRIDTLLAERARHAEEIRKVEGERDAERKHATEMEERALDLVRDLRLANVELTSLRSLLPDVRACAEYVIGEFPENHPAALTGSRILASLDSQGGEGE